MTVPTSDLIQALATRMRGMSAHERAAVAKAIAESARDEAEPTDRVELSTTLTPLQDPPVPKPVPVRVEIAHDLIKLDLLELHVLRSENGCYDGPAVRLARVNEGYQLWFTDVVTVATMHIGFDGVVTARGRLSEPTTLYRSQYAK